MGKSSRTKARDQQQETKAGEVGPRQPCPCGSGRRYKACHGAAGGAPDLFVSRPFEGMPSECDVVALRELVPAATAPLTLKDSDRVVQLCSLLPMAAPAMVRESGEVWLGLQVQHGFGDPARDLAAVLLKALEAEVGIVGLTDPPGPGPRLQDLITGDRLDVTVHKGFDYWVADVEDSDGSVASALEQANDAAAPTERVAGVPGAYWTSMGNREYLRWVLPHDENRVLDGFARLHVRQAESLVEGDRLIGMFRAHGVVAPVWDLPLGTGAAPLEDTVPALLTALEEVVADSAPLTSEERAARAGLSSRQLTIR